MLATQLHKPYHERYLHKAVSFIVHVKYIIFYYKKKFLSNDTPFRYSYTNSINRLDQLKKNFAHYLRTLFLLFSNPCMFRVSVSTRERERTSVTNTSISIRSEGTQIYGRIPIFPEIWVCRDTQFYGIPIFPVGSHLLTGPDRTRLLTTLSCVAY